MPRVDMKCVKRESISDDWEVCNNSPIPDVPRGGARVKVHFAGANYTEGQLKRSGRRRPRLQGIRDTSLMPGFEISGVIDEICNSVRDNSFQIGDRCVVYPEKHHNDLGNYEEYITVNDIKNVVKIPQSLPLEVAAMLPTTALTAQSAVLRAKPFVQNLMNEKEVTNVLIVGAGGLGLWTLKMAKHYLGPDCSKVRVTVADGSIEKLMVASSHGCYDVIHWAEEYDEGYLIERTYDVCRGGVDVVIDFVSSPRSITRSLKCLNEGGTLMVGGTSKIVVSMSMNELAAKGHSVIGVQRGTRNQLQELVGLFAAAPSSVTSQTDNATTTTTTSSTTTTSTTGVMTPPTYSIYPVEEANQVFEKLEHSQITGGRAVLRVTAMANAITA